MSITFHRKDVSFYLAAFSLEPGCMEPKSERMIKIETCRIFHLLFVLQRLLLVSLK